MELKIRVKEYHIFGDDNEYLDITFKSNSDEEIKVSSLKNKPFYIEEAVNVSVEFMQEVLEIIKSKQLFLSLEVEKNE